MLLCNCSTCSKICDNSLLAFQPRQVKDNHECTCTTSQSAMHVDSISFYTTVKWSQRRRSQFLRGVELRVRLPRAPQPILANLAFMA